MHFSFTLSFSLSDWLINCNSSIFVCKSAHCISSCGILRSNLPQVYIHYFGTESSKSILEIKGIIKRNDREKFDILKSRDCPNCNEPNKRDSKFCIKCKMILSYNYYNETVENENEMKDALAQLSDQLLILTERIQKLEKNK